ncbi:MAG: hypothetical protein DRI52_00825 [Chloroflexi bacterium]|nr:MAG: hypothetical protein DRI52_00825 [Chloroflexota bacterium]
METYRSLDKTIKRRVRKAHRLWMQNPFHSSLHFKCINAEENIWSVRITLGYRAIGILEDDTVTGFWIGSHDDYERFFS